MSADKVFDENFQALAIQRVQHQRANGTIIGKHVQNHQNNEYRPVEYANMDKNEHGV